MRPDVRRWYDRRTSSAPDWPLGRLRELAAGTTATVVLPARNEAGTVGPIVAALRTLAGLVDEVVVVDSASSDATAAIAAAAGAHVVAVDRPGKGRALSAGLAAATGDVVAFVDADLEEFDPAFVRGLLGPLFADPSVSFVKGTYRRAAGRVTELVARPLLNLHWPGLAGIEQPLGGEYAGRRALLEALPFEPGYGVDLGLLVDALDAVGLDGIAQVDLGRRVHRHHDEATLGRMAAEVWQAALRRLGLPPAATTLTQFAAGHPITSDVGAHPLPPVRAARAAS